MWGCSGARVGTLPLFRVHALGGRILGGVKMERAALRPHPVDPVPPRRGAYNVSERRPLPKRRRSLRERAP
eukprot:807589-Prymnesium_polylepis.2